MEQYTINDEHWNEVVSGCGKIMAVGDTMYFMDERDLMIPDPIGIFHQFGCMVNSTAQKIQKIMNAAEEAAIEEDRAKREIAKDEPVTDAGTIESFKSGIKKLFTGLEAKNQSEILNELAETMKGSATEQQDTQSEDGSEIDPRSTPEFKAGLEKSLQEIIMMNYEALSPDGRDKITAELTAFKETPAQEVTE